ncbi:hypothetical protein ABKN59_004251 [Abortiporus biennis]
MHQQLDQDVSQYRERRMQELSMDLFIPTLYQQLEEMTSHRNSYAPVSRIPNELLCKILIFYASNLFLERDPTLLGLINVANVCRRWRTVAIAFKQYWSFRRLSDYWDPSIHLRSGSLPIDVLVNLNDPSSTSRLISSFTQIYRYVRTLFIQFPLTKDDEAKEGVSNQFLQFLQSCPVPSMESIIVTPSLDTTCLCGISDRACLRHSRKSLRTRRNIHIENFSLFTGQTPRLHTLHLERCRAPWNSTLLCKTLRSLTLKAVAEPCSNPRHMQLFLSTLAHLRLLEKLDILISDSQPSSTLWPLEHYISDPIHYAANESVVSLPSLRTLRIYGTLGSIVSILSCISVPLATTLQLLCSYNCVPFESMHPGKEFTSLFNLVSCIFGGESPARFSPHNISLIANNRKNVTMLLGDDIPKQGIQSSPESISVILALSRVYEDEYYDPILGLCTSERLLSFLPGSSIAKFMSDVDSITLVGPYAVPTQSVFSMWGKAISVNLTNSVCAIKTIALLNQSCNDTGISYPPYGSLQPIPMLKLPLANLESLTIVIPDDGASTLLSAYPRLCYELKKLVAQKESLKSLNLYVPSRFEKNYDCRS